MNKIIILLTIICLASCGVKPTKNYILFSGTIADARSNEFSITKRFDNQVTRTIPLAEDGYFTDTLTSGTGHYSFRGFGGMNVLLYLTNGGEYNLTANGANVQKLRSTAKVSGTDPDASNYLITKYENINRLRGDYADFNSLNESDFRAKAKMLYESYLAYLDSFSNIPKEFAEFEREELHYYYLLSLIKFESLHKHFTKQSDFKISESFLKELEGVDYLNEDTYKLRGSYTTLVKLHFEAKAKELEDDSISKYLAKLITLGAIPNDYIKNDLLKTTAIREISYVANLEKYYKTYISLSSSPENDKQVTEKYEALKKVLKGQTSPVFTDYINHAGGTTSLDNFKGKYVYVDVWATWCGPCLAEVPSLKKVEKQYHGKNIEFVSISVDTENKREAWRKMVMDKKLAGIQLIADKAFESDFISAYEINSIPRFIIIDPKGNIISSNAPRPSDPKLIELFNELKL